MSVGTETRERGTPLDVAHFWQPGDGAEMFEAVLERFRSKHPNVTITEQSYENHGLSIKSRMLQENSPSLFVEWPGRNLDPYVEASAVRDVTEFWDRLDLERSFIEGPADLASYDGKYLALPVDIHRMNNLFYNVELVEEVGVDPATVADPRELIEVLEQAADEGVVGLQIPMKNPWTVLMLWSGILIAQFGANVWEDVAAGTVRPHESEIRESVEILDDFAELASDDASFLDMIGANDRFMEGESLFFHQGDWVAGMYEEREGFDYQAEWDHVPFPGSEGTYRMGVDSFVGSATEPNTEDMESFLAFMAAPETLELLNRKKGSIPPRRDVSMDRYPQFLQDQFDDFTAARDFVSGHSSDVPPESFIEAKTAASNYMASRDVETAAVEFIDAYA